MKLRKIGTNYLVATPPIITVGALIFGTLGVNRVIIWYGMLAVLGNMLNQIIKRIIGRMHIQGTSRPASTPKAGCGEFPGDSCIGRDTVGMPSGHCQFIAMFATYFTLFVWRCPSRLGFTLNESGKYCVTVGMWSLVGLVAGQRMNWGFTTACHSFDQVMMGSALGLILGYISYIVVK